MTARPTATKTAAEKAADTRRRNAAARDRDVEPVADDASPSPRHDEKTKGPRFKVGQPVVHISGEPYVVMAVADDKINVTGRDDNGAVIDQHEHAYVLVHATVGGPPSHPQPESYLTEVKQARR